jgi:hypothetical protein
VNRCRSAQRAYLALAHNAQQSQVSRLPLAGWQFSTDLSALLLPPAHRDMQPEAHRVENTENSCEVWLLWIARKRTINALPREPRLLRKVRDIVQSGGGGNGATNFNDIRLLQRLIYEIGSRLSGT